MRNQIAMAGRLGLRAATINSGNTDEWDAVAPRPRGRRHRRPAHLAGAPRQRALRDRRPAEHPGLDRPVRRRRGALHLRLGPRLPARLPADRPRSCARSTRACRCWRRPPPPTTGSSTTSPTQLGDGVAGHPRAARARLARARCDRRSRTRPSGWRGSPSSLPADARQRHRLLPDRRRHPARRHVPARARASTPAPYNADLSTEEREALEDALVANELKALVATVALGMGFDKPDLGFVVHYQRPGSAIAYYQQVGRAGRAVDTRLRRRSCPVARTTRSPSTSWTPRSRRRCNMHEILDALEAADSMTSRAARAGGQPAAADGSSRRSSSSSSTARWPATAAAIAARPKPWEQDEERIARVIAARRHELAQMQAYMTHDGCLMEFLARPARRPDRRAVRSLRELPRSRSAAVRRRRSASGRPSRSCAGTCGRSSRASSGRPARSTGCRARSPHRTSPGWRCASSATPGWGGRSSAAGRSTGRSARSWSRRQHGRSGTAGTRRLHRPGSRPSRPSRGAGSSRRSLVRWRGSSTCRSSQCSTGRPGSAPQAAMRLTPGSGDQAGSCEESSFGQRDDIGPVGVDAPDVVIGLEGELRAVGRPGRVRRVEVPGEACVVDQRRRAVR